MTGGRSANPRALPALTAGLCALIAGGVALVGLSLAGTSIRLIREACVVAGFIGWAMLAVGAVWVTARLAVWDGVGGPWWNRLSVDADHLGGTAARVAEGGAAGEAWARAGLATARALAADNIALCRRMDRVALRRSRWWTPTGMSAADTEDDPIAPMWASLLDGRARLVELSRELRSQMGRHLAAAPIPGWLPDSVVVDELGRVTERLRALDAARLEVEDSGGPGPKSATPVPPTDWKEIADAVTTLVAAKAPDDTGTVRRACAQAAAALDTINATTARIEADIACFPPEAPARSRALFETPRRERLDELGRFSDELWAAATDLFAAASTLQPLPAAPRRPPREVERKAVSAAEGMIAALREVGAESDEMLPPASADPTKPRARRSSRGPGAGHNRPVP